MNSTTITAVQSTNWGGKYWGQLKRNPDMNPSWDKLKMSALWTDEATCSGIWQSRDHPVKKRHCAGHGCGDQSVAATGRGAEGLHVRPSFGSDWISEGEGHHPGD